MAGYGPLNPQGQREIRQNQQMFPAQPPNPRGRNPAPAGYKPANAGPYGGLKAANLNAGKAAAGLGNYGMKMAGETTDKAMQPWNAQAGMLGQWGQGKLGEQGFAEKLFQARLGGGDPAYEASWKRQFDQGAGNISSKMAAMGLHNSGATANAVSNYGAQVESDRSRDLFSQAMGAQGAGDARQRNLFAGGSQVAGAMSGIQERGGQEGWERYSSGQLAEINSKLAAAGVDYNRMMTDKAYADQMWPTILGVVGAIGGGFAGGPAGAAAGYGVGSNIGQLGNRP